MAELIHDASTKRPRRWRRAAIALASVCVALVGLVGGQYAHGQQPVVNAAPQPPVLPTPEPETVPPGEAEKMLSLADLEQMALASNPSVARASALVGAARGNWIQVGLPPNPSIGYDGQQLGSGGRAEQQGVLFSQEFVRGGKLRLNRAIADRELALAQQELAAQQQRVLTDVRIAFYQVLLAQRAIDLTENLLGISAKGVETVETLFRAKEANRADVLQAQLEVENARILARNARNRHTAAWQGLTAVAGDPKLPPQPLAGDAFAAPLDIDFQETLQYIQTASPEVAAAAMEIDRARAALDRARVEPVPNVSVQGLVNVIDNGIGGRPDAGITVSVPIPLFNRNQGAILQSQHQIAAAERALQQLELGIQNRLAAAYERYTNARYQVERYRTAILPAASESLDLMRKTYEAGETNYVSFLVAQRTYFQTNINYLEAIQALRIAEAEIEGLLLSNSLQER
jgi:cobalt-zinc-cadmium efflux system outer membrane protein